MLGKECGNEINYNARVCIHCGAGKGRMSTQNNMDVQSVGMNMEMNVNVVFMVVNNAHPKDLSKSPVAAGFFVCGMLGILQNEESFI